MTTSAPSAVAAALARMAQRLPRDGSISAGEAAALDMAVAMLGVIDRHRDGLRELIHVLRTLPQVGPGTEDGTDDREAILAAVRANPTVAALLAAFPDAEIIDVAPLDPVPDLQSTDQQPVA